MSSTETVTVTVSGMTCDHCARSVASEVGALPGVTDVAVDLATGRVDIRATQPIPDEQLRDAVAEAGYTLAS